MSECEQCAREIFKALPESIHVLLGEKTFKGKVVKKESDTANCTADDVKDNYSFLRVLVRTMCQRLLEVFLLFCLCFSNLDQQPY